MTHVYLHIIHNKIAKIWDGKKKNHGPFNDNTQGYGISTLYFPSLEFSAWAPTNIELKHPHVSRV